MNTKATMDIPKFHETFNPILEILSNGQTLHTREMQKQVIEKYYSSLPEELLNEKTKSGEILINNRIAWGKSYLKKGGFLSYPERGYVKITEKGLKNKSALTLKKIEEDSSLFSFYTEEKLKVKTKSNEIKEIKNATPQDLIDQGFSSIELEIKNELLERLRIIDPYYFEKVILILLKKNGLRRVCRNN